MEVFRNMKKEYDSFNLEKLEDELESIGLVLNNLKSKDLLVDREGAIEITQVLSILDHLPENYSKNFLNFQFLLEDELNKNVYLLDEDLDEYQLYTSTNLFKYGINPLNCPDDLDGDISDCSWLSSDILY